MKVISFASRVGLVLLLAGCSAVVWENPGKSPDELAFDRQSCRSLARAESERVLRRQPIPTESRGNIIGSEYDAAMARYDLRRTGDRTFVRCMENRGYRKTSKPLL